MISLTLGSLSSLHNGFNVPQVCVLEVLKDGVLLLEVVQPSGKIGLFGLVVILVNHKGDQLIGEYKVSQSELVKHNVIFVSYKVAVLCKESLKTAFLVCNYRFWNSWFVSLVIRLNYPSIV